MALTWSVSLPAYLADPQDVPLSRHVLAVGGTGPVTYGAMNLPQGLSIDPDTGYITGTPLNDSVFDVGVNATDGVETIVQNPKWMITTPTGGVPCYCTVADLARVVGQPVGQDDRLSTAVVLGSRYVDLVLGNDTPDESAMVPPYTVALVACPPSWHQGAIAAAARYLKSPDVPFGALGGLGDLAVYVKGTTIPEVDLILTGKRTSWGVS